MVIRVLLFILLGFVTAFCGTILSNITAILGVAPDYTMIIIMLVILRQEFSVAFPAVLMISLIADALNPSTFGYGAFLRFGLSTIIYELKQHMNLDLLPSRLYVIAGAELVFQLVYQLIIHSFDFGIISQVYLESALPTLGYTFFVAFIIFFVLDLDIKLDVKRREIG